MKYLAIDTEKKSTFIGISSGILFLVITLSGSIITLLFEKNNNLENYVFLHNFMAISGILTPIVLVHLSKQGARFTIATGSILLGLGNIISTYTGHPITTSLAGLFLGIGISITNLAIRSMIFSLPDIKERKISVANLSINLQVAKFISNVIGAALIAGVLFNSSSMMYILYGTAFISILIPLPIWNQKLSINRNDTAITFNSYLVTMKKHKLILFFIIAHQLCTGFYLNTVGPFLNILLSRTGIIIPHILLITASCALLCGGIQWYLSRRNYADKLWSGFIISSMLMLATLFIIPAVMEWKLIVAACIILFQILHAVLVFFIRFIELRVFHSNDAAVFYSLSHMIFLIGNMAGGSIGTYLFKYRMEKEAFLIAGIALFCSLTVSLYLLKKILARH